jgi:hypothetical protein
VSEKNRRAKPEHLPMSYSFVRCRLASSTYSRISCETRVQELFQWSQ